MNFVTQLEDYLRDLGAEARKNHPGVKEASERAIMKLRSLQNDYASAVRKASSTNSKHPDTRLFRSSDLLHPFLLATNYPNASPKLLDTSFKAFKLLLEADAICPGDGTNMVRVWMIQAQVVVAYSKEVNKNNKKEAQTAIGAGQAMEAPNSGNNSSSWFGGYFSSNPNTTNAVTTKTAISSTHGNAGSGHLNARDLEKLALDILSCLLQLLELKDLPISDDQWIQSVTLCCLLYLPTRHTVRQAAHSTLPQVLSLLFRAEDVTKLKVKTWDDLLSCALGMASNAATGDAKLRSSSNSQMKRISKISCFHGAFSNCRFGDWEAAQPPSQALALELMSLLLPESPDIFETVGQKTFGVIVQCFQNHLKQNCKAMPMEVLKALQFALVVLQTQGTEWSAECRELIGRLIQPISLATEALRKQVDFEDGYIYKVPNKPISTKKSTVGNKYSIETLQGLPPTVLWKAALSMETLKLFIEDKKSCKKLWLHEDVAAVLLEATSDFCTIGASCEDHMNMIIASCRGQTGTTSAAYSAEALEKIERWNDGKNNDEVYVLGDALWTGFQTLLMMIDQLDESMLDQTFAPSLSVLQHYLKRFPASGTIVEKSLEGYFSLAKVSLNNQLLRGALLSSLCKLSLPQWGRKDSGSLLKDHNVAALLCLLNIVHRQKDRIGTDWSLILQTFEELSVLAIASPDLSNSAYAGALSISAAYARIASFSTCLSDDSLSQFVKSVKEVSLSDKGASTIPSVANGRRNLNTTNTKAQESRGAKLINIGARAIGWNSESNDVQEDVPVADRTKNMFYDDYQHEFDNRLTASRYPIRARQIPFSIALLADAAMCNTYRHSRSGADLFRQICSLASEIEAYRPFFMDLMAMLIVTHVMKDEATIPASFFGPGKIVFATPRQNQLLATEKAASDDDEKSKPEPVSQIDLLGPLCDYISSAKTAAVAEGGLEALYTVLESTGHKLESQTWVHVVEAIAAVPSWEHSSADWTAACQIGFRCLKLIVDDFLEDAAKSARTALLECCSTFGSARHDMNTSLTAIGLLWTIADQDSGTESVDRALAKLVLLSGDHRAEVRNCSVNTLFSCIVGRGQKFTGKQWESCICKTIFGVYDTATSDTVDNGGALDQSTNSKKSRYQVNVHHSRDSADKQWVATQALVLKGMCRLLRNFFDPLLKTTDVKLDEKETPWFDKAWSKILGWAYDASIQEGGRDTLDLRNSGVELMVLCTQLSCAAGIHAAITPARVGTNMEVINGALRSVGSPEKSKNGSSRQRVHSSDVVEMWRENLFLDAFDNLEEFREHLESESSIDNDSEPAAILESTEIQVLTKLASELSKLYDCCKENEFKEDVTLSTYTTFLPFHAPVLVSPTENDAMVVRFVRVVRTIAKITSSGKDSRFLSQAQRACLEIFKTMSANGSPEAFFNLTVFASAAFYAETEANGKCKKGVDILSHEMTSTLLESYKSKSLTDPCKTLILTRLLSLFLSDNHGLGKDDIGTSYKMLIPIIQEGLKSAKVLASEESSQRISNLLDNAWERVCLTLSRMLSPTISSKGEDSILHSSDLVEIVISAAENAPSNYAADLCTIFFSGASRCLETIRQGTTDMESFLNLFAACFSGMCHVGANDVPTHGIAEQVLSSAYESLESDSTEIDWNVKAALKVCQVLSTTSSDVVVIAVLSQLSNLVGVEERSMRRAAGSVLASANIRGVLQEANNQRLAAEERATAAESRVEELERQIAELRNQNQTPAGLLLLD